MTMLHDCFLPEPEHQELKPQRLLSSLQNRYRGGNSEMVFRDGVWKGLRGVGVRDSGQGLCLRGFEGV